MFSRFNDNVTRYFDNVFLLNADITLEDIINNDLQNNCYFHSILYKIEIVQ